MKKLYNSKLLVVISLIILSCNKKETQNIEVNVRETNVIEFVDPFIGTGGHGHTYPGATAPFGMVQVSPDNGTSGWDWCSGYHYSDSLTIGFSHLHLSGTGIGDLADIRIMPVNKKVDLSIMPTIKDSIPYASRYSHSKEKATPGYYSVYLEDHNINAELTADTRTAFHRYSFQDEDIQSVILDLGFTINWDKTVGSQINIEDKYTISGYRYSSGWAKNQKVFFVIKFSKSILEYDLYVDKNKAENIKSATGENTFAQLFFNEKTNTQLKVKVGVSSVSIENAKDNISDHKDKFEFDTIKEEAGISWEKTLSKIDIETKRDSLKTIFYTALYHSQIAPVTYSDKNGALRKENDSIIYAKDYTAYSTLSLWDTFRSEHPLLIFLTPDRVSDMINSMLAYYEDKKILPVWTLYANETNTMTGYHSVSVIAEAYLKGIRGFDIEKAYDAMKTTMMQDERGLDFYKEYGYIPYNLLDESVTITLEYAYNDWCVAQMAKTLGKNEDYDYFLKRSKAYTHLFDPETGFMRGKSKNGTEWHEPFDPKYSAHRVHADYTEGNAWQHSWFVPHDVENLIRLYGEETDFITKLEQLFTEDSEITGDNISADISGLIGQYAHGNEPSHHIAYMFNKANAPWKTQYWVSQILKTQYNTTPNGLSGNEDCGQMSAWYIFSSLGIYPMNPASGEYQIGTPIFEKATLKLSDEIRFIIEAENVSENNIYIQSATLNGKTLNRSYITHQEIMQGGTLHFVMGASPNKNWGVNK
ncbi:GH92 family glycosyl hydrolase [Aquimarina sp. 2201CG5-10]|uniref:GH92 family glycosyl hydrolase n=1 Tax=Aquimarina callyspongiae TaxID=3098150 RepID=UPI002AB59E0A|nr:GH92 family glycosyl hydrolase [Aquimarina sp. 2201CG5-10]MDY8138389.1 GH92 family glycosyl hydrolase [Aquimarina sp. 2201CG5-10]